MKKYIAGILGVIILLFGTTGCESDDEFLKEKSYSINTASFYNSVADIDMAINYGYARVQYMLMGEVHSSCSWLLMGIGLDTFTATGQNSIGSTNFVMGLNSSHGFVDHWFRNQYYVIYDLNKAIQKFVVLSRRFRVVDLPFIYIPHPIYPNSWKFRRTSTIPCLS